MDWRDAAACRTEDPELFFPVGTDGPALVQLITAKSVCGRCAVLIECRTWALTTGEDTGVWGGLSEDERRVPRGQDQLEPARRCRRAAAGGRSRWPGVHRPERAG